MKYIQIKVPKELLDRYKLVAKKNGLTLVGLIKMLLAKELDKHEI